ncbi:hypothetical protein T4B_6129 [Trichinella pseudospiralis]|uniref:Uncharacterized protein n=1 Tax=Trichinella pseudospiralis TaxID=6337 RepID=A0A0V1GI08_TRIPS|nr:hypothetical protein T4A_8043 [Trichinella pseudospiralis]KRY97427.1 hypothetical protein T4B_5388 [Trichinella pseudospiralis]KRY97430.1 hypothetical protein T4B_6129 [Trichinella pseudospiralis]KRY99648.1 hypothetical protein T4C_2127 [Trichinella pseudospiralis]KRY99660.1 hypothetical protein T4C_2811 [Trichinella pseudospiralis]
MTGLKSMVGGDAGWMRRYKGVIARRTAKLPYLDYE